MTNVAAESIEFIVGELNKLGGRAYDMFNKQRNAMDYSCSDQPFREDFLDCVVEQANMAYECVLEQVKRYDHFKDNQLLWEQKNRKEVYK